MRTRHAAALVLLACLVLDGCGGGSSAEPTARTRGEGTVRMAMADVGSLDPARAETAQDTELDWALYTGLVTYRHARGEAGSALIPGLATALPRVSDGGRVYAVTLRRGLRFSNGRPLRASDVVATIERTIRTTQSPVRSLLVPVIAGAAAFAADRARSISGVTGDDASGQVTIRLRRRDAAFDALLADPSLGIVPAGTPLHDRRGHPPPGIGPYRLQGVHPGRSFTLARNPYWSGLPGIPVGQVDVDVILSPDASAGALAVLNDVLDVEDPAQTLPPDTLREIRREGAGRDAQVPEGRPDAFLFLDTRTAPFDDRLAREGVVEGLAAQGFARGSALAAECDVVPVLAGTAVPDACPPPAFTGEELASARALVARSGTAGAAVTVWSPRTGPEREWLQQEADVLRVIGYAARIQTVPETTYRSQIAALVPRPVSRTSGQGGRSSGSGPVVARHTIESSHATAEPVAADAVIDGRIASTIHVSATGALPVAVGPDRALRHVRRAADVVFAEEAVPELVSWRIDEAATVIDAVEGLDFTSLRLR